MSLLPGASWNSRRSTDDLHPGRRGLRLSFELSKGSYATILVKRLTDVAGACR